MSIGADDFTSRRTPTPAETLDTTYIRKTAIATLEKKLVLTDMTTPGELPMNAGSTLRWHIDVNLADTSSFNALTHDSNDGASGIEATYGNRDSAFQDVFTTTQVEQQIQTYGTFIPTRTTDLDDMPASVMDRISKRLGYRGAEVLDRLIRGAADGTANADPFFPGYGTGTTNESWSVSGGTTDDTTIDVTDTLSAEDIALAVGKLWAEDVDEFDNGRYRATVHSGAAIHLVTDVEVTRITWEGMNKFVSGFNGQEKLTDGHLGAIIGCDIIRTNGMDDSTQRGTVPIDAYTSLVMGKDALGMVSRGDFMPDIKINRPTSNSMSDPHRLWATTAFQFQAAPVLLDSLRVVMLHSAKP